MKIATKKDWKTLDLPNEVEQFIYERNFSEEELKLLSYGFIPEEMEDKWFIYMENNTLYFHRSWTGICIFKIEFKPNNKHIVIANNNKEQFTLDSNKKLIELDKLINMLLEYYKKQGE